MNCSRMLTRLTAVLLALMLIGFPVVTVAQESDSVDSTSDTALQSDVLDLPAMTLTPSELDEAGYDDLGLSYGGLKTLDVAAQDDAEIRGGATADNDAEYARLLRDAGWQGAHESLFAAPNADDPNEFSRRIWSIVTQYADDEGAARAFAALSDGGDVTAFTVEELPWSDESADGSRVDDATLWRYDTTRQSTGAPFHALELHLRLGNLTAFLSLQEEGERQPDVTAIRPLADALLHRVDAVKANSGPRLSASALRFALPSDVSSYDNYARLNGVEVRYYGESPAAAKRRVATYPDVPAIYVVYQYLPVGEPDESDDVTFRSYTYQFDSESAASAWSKKAAAGVELMENAPAFGDESFLCACAGGTTSDGTAPHGYAAVIRVGARVVLFNLLAAWDISPEAFIDVAQAQTDCLANAGCLQPTPIPESLATATVPDRQAADGNVAPLAGQLFPDLASKEESR
jgi:hypothetical protein